jgi:hypothetical protein
MQYALGLSLRVQRAMGKDAAAIHQSGSTGLQHPQHPSTNASTVYRDTGQYVVCRAE